MPEPDLRLSPLRHRTSIDYTTLTEIDRMKLASATVAASGARAGGMSSAPQSPLYSIPLQQQRCSQRHRSQSSIRRNNSSRFQSPSRTVTQTSSIARSQSMRTAKRPQSSENNQQRFRQRIASIPGDMSDHFGGGDVSPACVATNSKDSISSAIQFIAGASDDDRREEVQRLRNFAVTSKGIVNRGDSFRSKSRSTHSVAPSTPVCGSTQKLTVENPACATVHDIVVTQPSVDLSPVLVPLQGSPTDLLPVPDVPTEHTLAKYRVLVLGGVEVGKSSLTHQFMTSEYICSYDVSLDEEHEVTVQINLNNEESELVFVEHSGVEELRNPVSMYNPDAYLVVYSVTSRSSLMQAKDYLSVIRKWDNMDNKAVILVGNKTDLVRLRTVTTEDGRALATREVVKFIETSVGIDHNVDELLAGLLHQIRLKQQVIIKQQLKRSHSMRVGTQRNNCASCASSFTGSKAKIFIKKFLRKACSRSRSCDNLHVL